jgi:hypothetical protein
MKTEKEIREALRKLVFIIRTKEKHPPPNPCLVPTLKAQWSTFKWMLGESEELGEALNKYYEDTQIMFPRD